MTDTKFKLGDILKVSRNAGDYWYEKVIEVTPEIITEDMPEEEGADISKQGLTENFNYEVVETFKISSALKAQKKQKHRMMKRLSITAVIMLSAMLLSAQPGMKGYAAFASAWVPGGNNTGWIACQLTAGRQVLKCWFVEYNQTITLTPDAAAAKLLQGRAGPQIQLSRELMARPFVGYSITSVPKNEVRKVGHSLCFGAYLIQDVGCDFAIKYEVSCNNNFLLIPSIGAIVKF